MATTLLSIEQRITEMAAHIHRAITASTCSGNSGGSWRRSMFPSTSCSTPTVSVRNGAIGSAMSSAAPTGRECCSMVLSEAEGLLRIAIADLETAVASSDPAVFREGAWGF